MDSPDSSTSGVSAFSGISSGFSGSVTSSATSVGGSGGADSRRAIRVAQASADAKLHSEFEKATSGGAAFNYSATVDASRGITHPSATSAGATPPRAGPDSDVTAYLQRMQRGGQTQSFGCMFLLNEANFNIRAYSENAAEMMGFLQTHVDQSRAPAPPTLAPAPAPAPVIAAAAVPAKTPAADAATHSDGHLSLAAKIKRSIMARNKSAHSPQRGGGTADAAHKKSWNPFNRGSADATAGSEAVPGHGTQPAAAAAATDVAPVAPEAPAQPTSGPVAGPKVVFPKVGLGVSALSLFTRESCVSLRKLVTMDDVSTMSPLLVQSAVAERPFYAIFHRTPEGLHVDLEPIRDADGVFTSEGALQAHRLANKSIAKLQRAPAGDLQLLCETVVQEVRELTGYDRVMAYKFHEDEHGEVVAEAKKETMEPYLGLHYPATDVPQASRFLFLKNRVRIIANCDADNVPVVQEDKLKGPVVLANSTLRAVHGCHAQYMRNMGTLGSMVMAVIVNDPDAKVQNLGTDKANKLWGLVVCHQEQPRYLPYPLRLACEFLMQVFSLKVNLSAEMVVQEKEKDMLKVQTLLCDMLQRDAPVGIVTQYPNIMDLVKCDGAALLYGGRFWLVGTTPTETQMLEVVDWLQQEHGESSGFSTDSLKDSGYPHADKIAHNVCGMIAAQLLAGDYLFWFRCHVEKEVAWGGARHEPGEKDDGAKMNPRASFAAFLEVVKNRSVPWDDLEIDAVSSLVLILRGHLASFSASDMRSMEASRLAEKDIEKLSIAESELSRILETATAPVFTVDRAGCITAWNAKMAQLTGLTAGEAMGLVFVKDLLQDVSKDLVKTAFAMALKGEEAKQIEMRVKRFASRGIVSPFSTPGSSPANSGALLPRGKMQLVGESVLLMNAFVSRGGLVADDEEGAGPGAVAGVCFVGQDLTTQKIVEGHFTKVQGDYAAIVHSGNSLIPPIFAIDESGLCAEWNPAMESVTGLGRREVLGHMILGELFGGVLKMKADAYTRLMIVLNKGVSGNNTEHYPLAFISRQGELVEALLTVNARRDAMGQVMGAFCFLHTASPELQAALKLQRAAEEFAEAKARAVAYLRDQIKGPLEGIKYVRSKMAEWAHLGEKERKILQTCLRLEQQLTRVLDDDNIENLEEGFLGLESDEYHIEDVLDAVVTIGQQGSAKKGISFDSEASPPLSKVDPLCGDAVRLQQALADFLSVALQCTPEGGKGLLKTITGLTAEPGALGCEFRIVHSGEGVLPQMIEQMLDNCESKMQMTQEGLALSVARKIVQAMDGDVEYRRSGDRCEFIVHMALAYPREPLSCTTPGK